MLTEYSMLVINSVPWPDCSTHDHEMVILLNDAIFQIYRSFDKQDDCDLWKDSWLRQRITRYLCYSKEKVMLC